ncbi:protein ZGRF1-like [Ruditapes philippinarum]|uniref:protein ZGRF1-like n=1 Tax=Ruditapes philippinarum TaxID=129788 RepID=UPI00295B57FE|nr:protein ZGRF1-like [Ruditapes philippinarum]
MTEPASLLPIARFACQKLLLVGDPKQLDPTIQGADAAHQNGLEQTMFDRLIKMGSVPTLLRTQYRCHPYISAVANNLFYGGMLEDGISQTQRKPLLEILPTICYYDVERGVECCEAAGSYYNEREAQFVVFLLQVLLSSGIEPSAIGVITLYKSQMARISDLLTGQGDCTDMKGVQVSTVDAFQGGERDVIILSTVRSHACGFIDNDKRTNVALTRARHHLLIVGNLNNLSKNVLWGKVINHCKEYENGVQSADEARHSLEKYLENLKSCETSQNSVSSKSNSQSSTARETLTRKRKPRRKRKISEDHVDHNSASSLTNEQLQCSSNNSSKRRKNGAKQNTISDIDSVMDNVDFDEDFVEEVNMKSLDAAECDSSTISTHGDERPLTETTGNCQSSKQQREHRKHQDKLKTLTFDSDQENTDVEDVDNDDDLPTFSCD